MFHRVRNWTVQFIRLIGAQGLPHGVRVAGQMALGRSVVRFNDRGRAYWMLRDKATVHHLAYSVEALRKLAAYVDSTDTRIVDIGAHGGLFAAFAAERAPRAHITLVEPDPTLAPIISQNLSRHTNWLLIQKAVADESGELTFYRNQASTQTSSLLVSALDDMGGPTSVLRVESTTLNDLLPDDQSIDVLKIDIQGAEGMIIEGGMRTLRRVRVLLIEASLLDPRVGEMLVALKEEFGAPVRVNPVYAGADLAYRRTRREPGAAEQNVS